jgi:hypothetical protein
MSDFLGNLAARAVAATNAVRPRLPSRFESPPNAESGMRAPESERIADEDRSAVHSPQPAVSMVPSPLPAARTAQLIPAAHVEGQAALKPPPSMHLPVAPVAPSSSLSPASVMQPSLTSSPAVAGVPAPVGKETSPPAPQPAQQPAPEPAHAEGGPPPRKPAEPVIPQRVVVIEKQPVAAAVIPASPSSGTGTPRETQTEQPGPIIRVTIGRIDVRAVLPSAPVPARKAQAVSPVLSLDEYLKQRDGGQR